MQESELQAAPWSLLPSPLAWLVGPDAARRARVKTALTQLLIVANVVLGTRYILWRSWDTVNWDLWPLGVSLLLAEIFSYTDSLLFGLNMWRVRERGEPPVPRPGLLVDVFVTTYNEPVDLVRTTAIAARDIRYPHKTWVLDDGNRPEMRAVCDEIGVGYLVRSQAWNGKSRHAKAGNLINALYQTDGEFVLVLDADHVPRPSLLDRTLGYFQDAKVAFVQTPQAFGNTPAGDPFGSEAPLFYGPIQAGKDGWNSAFFCGSNAVLRREALMSIGVEWYARDLERRTRKALRISLPKLWWAKIRLWRRPEAYRLVNVLLEMVREARRRKREPLQEFTWRLHEELRRVGLTEPAPPGPDGIPLRLAADLLDRIDLHCAREAEAILPLSTISVTEDMATAMRLHSLGWQSVYHHEILAVGLAPTDLHAALQQRLRWAQGTLQVFMKENPLVQPGLSLAQRLLYVGTMWTYLSGFAAFVYLVAPVLYLVFGWSPVQAWSVEFFSYLLPWIITNQILFLLVGWGLPTWRGQQYSLALFALWMKAFTTTVASVWFGRTLAFVVTPKTRTALSSQVQLVMVQVWVMAFLAAAIPVGLLRVAQGEAPAGAVLVNVAWAIYDLVMLSVVFEAVRWRPAPEAA